MIYSETGGYQGIGFAIPSNLARQIMDELIKNHEVARGTIGLVALRDVDPARAEAAGYGRIKGVLIYNMYRNSSAYRSGLQLEDIITSVNGQEIGDAQQLSRMILDAKVGSTLKIGIIRDRRALTVNVPVEKMVADEPLSSRRSVRTHRRPGSTHASALNTQAPCRRARRPRPTRLRFAVCASEPTGQHTPCAEVISVVPAVRQRRCCTARRSIPERRGAFARQTTGRPGPSIASTQIVAAVDEKRSVRRDCGGGERPIGGPSRERAERRRAQEGRYVGALEADRRPVARAGRCSRVDSGRRRRRPSRTDGRPAAGCRIRRTLSGTIASVHRCTVSTARGSISRRARACHEATDPATDSQLLAEGQVTHPSGDRARIRRAARRMGRRLDPLELAVRYHSKLLGSPPTDDLLALTRSPTRSGARPVAPPLLLDADPNADAR